MWWTLSVSAAMVLLLLLGAYVLWPGPRRWLFAAWCVAMLVTTGWYTAGAYRLASSIDSLGEALRGLTSARPADGPADAPPQGERPPAPEPSHPRRWDRFPEQPECPVRVEVTGVTPARFTGVELQMRLTNLRPDATVDGVRFDAWCFDNFGDLLRGPGLDPPGFRMIDQQTIGPGQHAQGRWPIRFGADNCTRARVWVRSVHFTDGTRWEGAEAPSEAP